MSTLKDHFPEVMDGYYEMIGRIDKRLDSQIDVKNREFILVAVGIATGNENVIRFHAKRSMENGATRDELKSIALAPLPIIGITNCNKAIGIIDQI
jgi:alkylhydroperoxidase/carboxymuconolactone decarboxylase family protein YurZ